MVKKCKHKKDCNSSEDPYESELYLVGKFSRGDIHINMDDGPRVFDKTARKKKSRGNVLSVPIRQTIESKFNCVLTGRCQTLRIEFMSLPIKARADFKCNRLLIDACECQRDVLFQYLHNIDNRTTIIGDNNFIVIFFD